MICTVTICITQLTELRQRVQQLPFFRDLRDKSNVNVVDEMVSMITITRAYEAGQKMIKTQDSLLEQAVSSVGKV